MSQPRIIDVVSLGCSKNLVDSERLMKRLADAGFKVRFDSAPSHGQPSVAVVINTCGFIGDAKQESIDTILKWVEAAQLGYTKKVIVMGCLSERYRKELPLEIPEVDAWYGKRDWPEILRMLIKEHPGTAPYDRLLTTPRHHAYLKIAEGCNRYCAFCAIPLITGKYRSRTIESLEQEGRELVAKGVSELNVIAQDLSAYGKDIYGRLALPELVDRLADIEGVKRIRLHYAYPSGFPMELLDVMARRANVCNYLDIALQHISDPVLKNMRRHISGEDTRELLAEIRRKVPGIHLRTTLMVGFPGEGPQEFEELLSFVREQRFERMGAFAYCEEEDTYAAKTLPDIIPDEVKRDRLERVMKVQEEISLEIQERKIGQVFDVVVDREEEEFYVGRTEFDSPEVDPEVLIRKDAGSLVPGDYVRVRIEEALPFELIGTVVK